MPFWVLVMTMQSRFESWDGVAHQILSLKRPYIGTNIRPFLLAQFGADSPKTDKVSGRYQAAARAEYFFQNFATITVDGQS